MTRAERKEAIAQHIEAIMTLLGVDTTTPSLKKTPQRVADLYIDVLFRGLDPQHAPTSHPYPEPTAERDLVIIENIPLISICEHHLVPFIGHVTIRFMPNGYVWGWSRFYDLVRYHAQRPQLQERLTRELAYAIQKHVQTEDVCVTVRATHICILSAHHHDNPATITTQTSLGKFLTTPLASCESNAVEIIDCISS